MYKLFLCLRYLRRRRIAFFAVAAVCLCVAMVLIVVSVMSGFLQMVKDRSRGMLGDLIVENASLQGFPYYEEFIKSMKGQIPEIEEATPVIINYGVVRFPDDQITKYAQLVGIRFDETCRVNDFKKGLFYDKHYPGTTSFAPQSQPYYGVNEGAYSLPPDLEAARKKWESSVTPQEAAKAWRPLMRLFELPDKGYSRELNGGKLPADIRTSFAENFQKLPEKVRLLTIKRSNEWKLFDGDGMYTLQMERADNPEKYPSGGWLLRVYFTQYSGPGYYEPVTRVKDRDPDTLNPTWAGKAAPGAILGTDLCAKRQQDGEYDRYYGRGAPVQVMFMPFTPSGNPAEATGLHSKVFRYVDDERTGVYDIDSMSVYLDFNLLQTLLQMDEQTRSEEEGGGKEPPRTTQVQIKLKPEVTHDRPRTEAIRDHVQQIWDGIAKAHASEHVRRSELLRRVQVLTWEEKQAKFIGAVEKERYLVTLLFGVISVVAVFLVGCIFYMIVQQKTRDIGIIKSVGATSLGVAGIFLSYGAAVGVVGGAVGTTLGTVFVWYINDIQELLASIDPSLRVWNPEVYAFDHIPNSVSPQHGAVIYGVAIVASMLGSVIAAYRASRVWPVEALRYE